MFLFFAFVSFLVWAFFRTKTGTAITAVGSNPEFARASGIDVDKMRTISVVMSTVLGAIGILVYEQSFGFIQLYMGPFYMAFPAVAAILLGGASVNKATMVNVRRRNVPLPGNTHDDAVGYKQRNADGHVRGHTHNSQ